MKFSSVGSRDEYCMNNLGIEVYELYWMHSDVYVGPYPHPYALQQYTPNDGFELYLYGFVLTATEQNDFAIMWSSGGTAKQLYINCGSEGTTIYTSKVAINKGTPVQYNDYLAIVAVNNVGNMQLYQSALLVASKKID